MVRMGDLFSDVAGDSLVFFLSDSKHPTAWLGLVENFLIEMFIF
jgi:hypothetical protein